MVGFLSLHPTDTAKLNSVCLGSMILVVRADGKYWDGYAWSQQGKPFLTVAAATRSLCEEGEDLEQIDYVEKVRQ